MIFATPNQLNFKSTSRKDDLLSLCYLLVYLFKSGKVQFVASDVKMKKIEIFHYVKEIKTKMTPRDLVGPIDAPVRNLLEFIQEVYALGYDQAPDYSKLRYILIKLILREQLNFNSVYDWNRDYMDRIPDFHLETSNLRILKSERIKTTLIPTANLADTQDPLAMTNFLSEPLALNLYEAISQGNDPNNVTSCFAA